jgi:hypothetical protein
MPQNTTTQPNNKKKDQLQISKRNTRVSSTKLAGRAEKNVQRHTRKYEESF